MKTPRLFTVLHRFMRIGYCFIRQILLLVFEVPIVFWFMAKFKANALPPEHPWVTGEPAAAAGQRDFIWRRNIAFRSPSIHPESVDIEIVEKTGQFLAKRVARSVSIDEVPHGPQRRMPHAVNYLHGAVHYNGVFLIFDDFLDLIGHISNDQFRAEVLKLGRQEKREVTFLLRKRDYHPLEFAYCVGAVRAYLPWFSNGNGPTKKPVLWGNMAPYSAVNLINGSWIADMQLLLKGNVSDIVRPALDASCYFNSPHYAPQQTGFTLVDKLLAWYMYTDVRVRGFRGQLFFINRDKIEQQRCAQFDQDGDYWRWVACHKVPFPIAFAGIKRALKLTSA